ncbi:MAG: flagellar motor switch protein FliN, partial [Firmicutes bacterium HGW-Firmicutes-13]
MSDRLISQEEIDALLKGSESEDETIGDEKKPQESTPGTSFKNTVEPEQILSGEEQISERFSKTYHMNYKESTNNRKLPGNGKSNLNIIMDLPLEVSVILGSKEIDIKRLMEINSGTLIELNKLVDEPVDIYINGKLLARGEIIAIDENFGVRIMD